MSSRSAAQPDLEAHILATAGRLLEADGEAHFTMDQLAAASGTSRATIYRRFGHRRALLQRLARQHNLKMEELQATGDVRQRLLQATQAVLEQTGSLDFTLEQVAETAGVGVATLYRHFGNRKSLLRSLATHLPPRRTARELLSHPSGNLEADLLNFSRATLDFMQANRAIMRLVLSGDRQVQELFANLYADQERTLHSLERYLAEQLPSWQSRAAAFDLASAFLGMLLGLAFIKPADLRSTDLPEGNARLVVRLFLNGLGLESS